MCTDPITEDGKTFACRRCDDCIATRRHGWVARAMAEKAMHKHALCVALTYGNQTQEQRDAAEMFCYADVRAFLARLRSALRRQFGSYSLRFLCAGEQGDRNGRCHWHLILYSDQDLTQLGVFSRHGETLTAKADLMTVGKRKIRLDWTMWGNGFVTLQEPDQGGMSYVLSYCLKDQFTGEKSKDTMREASSENFATGLFRMSKRPAIGVSWLMQKLAALDGTHSVLPSTNLHVPEMSGYWYPSGPFREKLLWTLVALNQRAVWATGANAPQWSVLLASCKNSDKDMEILNGPQAEDDPETEESLFARRSRQQQDGEARRQLVERCAALLPCQDCLHYLSRRQLEELGVRRVHQEDGSEDQYEALQGYASVAESQGIRGWEFNPHCRKKGSKLARLTFPSSGA